MIILTCYLQGNHDSALTKYKHCTKSTKTFRTKEQGKLILNSVFRKNINMLSMKSAQLKNQHVNCFQNGHDLYVSLIKNKTKNKLEVDLNIRG